MNTRCWDPYSQPSYAQNTCWSPDSETCTSLPALANPNTGWVRPAQETPRGAARAPPATVPTVPTSPRGAACPELTWGTLRSVCSSCGGRNLPVLGVPSTWPSTAAAQKPRTSRCFHHWTVTSTVSPDRGLTRPSSNCQELSQLSPKARNRWCSSFQTSGVSTVPTACRQLLLVVSNKSCSKYQCPFRTRLTPKPRHRDAPTNLGVFHRIIES